MPEVLATTDDTWYQNIGVELGKLLNKNLAQNAHFARSGKTNIAFRKIRILVNYVDDSFKKLLFL